MQRLGLFAVIATLGCAAPEQRRPQQVLPLTPARVQTCGDDENCFYADLKARVGRNWQPIVELRRRDPNGVVYAVDGRATVLQLTVGADGVLKHVVVTAACGLEFLDKEAINAVHRSSPFARPPAKLLNAQSEVTFPFHLTLELEKPTEEQSGRL